MVAAQASSESTNAESCRRLESIARGMINALNTRDFNPQSKAWSYTSASWTAEVAFNTHPVKTNLQQYLAELEFMTRDNPDMVQHVLSMDVNLEDSSHGHAFANLEWHGFTKGFVRPCYAIYDFVRVQERWICVRFRVLPGIRAGSEAPRSLLPQQGS